MLSVRAGLWQLSMEKQSLGKSLRPCEQAFVLVSGKWEKSPFPSIWTSDGPMWGKSLCSQSWGKQHLVHLGRRTRANVRACSPLQTPKPHHTQLLLENLRWNQRRAVHSDLVWGFLVAHGSASHLNSLISREENAGKIQYRITLPVQSLPEPREQQTGSGRAPALTRQKEKVPGVKWKRKQMWERRPSV